MTKEKTRGKVVITYGTFDLFHEGHARLLYRARELGDFLIVGLSTDAFNRQKNKVAIQSYAVRKSFLDALSEVDLVIPEINWQQKSDDIIKYNADIFVMGDDWEGHFDYLKEWCEVRYFPRTEGVSSSDLRALLYEEQGL